MLKDKLGLEETQLESAQRIGVLNHSSTGGALRLSTIIFRFTTFTGGEQALRNSLKKYKKNSNIFISINPQQELLLLVVVSVLALPLVLLVKVSLLEESSVLVLLSSLAPLLVLA